MYHHGIESAKFRSFEGEIIDVLEKKDLSYDVAKCLYQSEGLISLERVNDIQNVVDKKTKAALLIRILLQQIEEDNSRFNLVVKELTKFPDLRPIMEKMTCK